MKEFNTPAARTAVSCRLGLCVLIALSLSGGGLFRGTRSLSDLCLWVRFSPFSPAAALEKCSFGPAKLRFFRLASGENHRKSPGKAQTRQTPRQLQPIDGDSFVDKLDDLTIYADRVEII